METVVAQEEKDGVYVDAVRFAEISGLSPWLVRKYARGGILPSIKARAHLIHLRKGLRALEELEDGDEPEL